MNGYRQEGFAAFDRNIHRGRRLSAAGAYLHPVRSRPNLEVRTRTFVTRILFEGSRGRGAARLRHPRIDAGEVICGGAINSPQTLQLSGSARRTSALGIDVVHDLPGVGENLQDHLEVYIQHAHPAGLDGAVPEVAVPALDRVPLAVLPQGPGATNHFEGGGFARSNDDVRYPNLMFHFLPIASATTARRRRATTATRSTSGCTRTRGVR